MLHEIDSTEFTEWMAYDNIDPFGDQRADLRAGIVAATVANFSMSPAQPPLTAADFMPFSKPLEEIKPVLLADVEAQSRLLKDALFGKKG